MKDPRLPAPRPDELRGRVIAVTGAGDGIGRAVAMAAAAHGAQVILVGRTVKKLQAVQREIVAAQGEVALIAPLDLEKALAKDYDTLAAAILERYGRLDGLVHCAGILGTLTPVDQFDVPTWCKVMHVNLTAAFVLTQVLLPALRASADASIVFSSSGVGRKGRAYWGAYAVSKFGIEGLTQVLAEELQGAAPVRVNALNPGATRTRMRRQAFPSENAELLQTPEDIAPAYIALLGASTAGLNGQSLDAQ
jgi:NAD(P)-dependent dehydrogenase (short-subunit alcohol dehydrogenase family)